ncbi:MULTISPECIES: LysR substrate-binding domain-containing protein [Phaeobacter]|uniref:LysR substrate-binding domain-containing protein n=1 Tax=Phaeobacter TaxID=302485 RepID=UPI00058F12A5|nr:MULTISPECIES: LysR substrate-binding domain-containing protein [Phaeobacter]ATG39914.1 HTH-type transcriptional regulator, lysR family [Phaeobacter piscinae]KII14087.1 LysR family transcriptional regulator [Phaeobacter sp. S60]UTS80895.1 Glycine cleavage system transcriptional activator [Phaeobacter piscinae]
MTDLPPLNSLRAFDAAGRRLSFRSAADELGVTQGAVAQQVRQLEAHLGVVLFERVPKGLAFTSVGRSFHNRIAGVFSDLRAATAELKPEPNKVLISVTPTFAAKWLIPNLPDFTAAHPDIDLRIMATERISSFHSDGIDLAVRQGSPPFGASLNVTLLFRQSLIAVAAPTFGDKGDTPLDPASLAKQPKIHDAHDQWPNYLAHLGNQDQSPRHLRLSQTSLAVDAAIAGQGVALVSRFLVAQDLKVGRLVEVGPAWEAGGNDFYVLMPRTAKNNETVVTVMTWLTERSADVSCLS